MRRNLLWGIVPVLVAAFWLLRGGLPPGLEDLVTRAWPALLVLAGLSLLLRGRVPLADLAAVALSVGLVAGLAFTAYSSRASQQRDDQQLPIQQDISAGITLLAVNVTTLNTQVEVIGTGADGVISGQFTGSSQHTLTLDFVEREDGIAEFTVTESDSGQFPLLEAVGRGTLRLELPPDVALVVAFNGREGNATFNLNTLALERLSIDLQRGDALITLPAYAPVSPNPQESPGQFIVREGNITVFLPENVAARLELNRAGNNIRPQFDERYILIDDGADGTLEKRNAGDDDIPLYYEITAPRGVIGLEISGEA